MAAEHPVLPMEAVHAALEALHVAEVALALPRRPTTFAITHRALRSAEGVPGLDASLVPDPHLRWSSDPQARTVDAVSASQVVVLGKYTRATQVKARGYLEADGRPATLKVWRMGPGESPLGARERDVRAKVARHAGYRAPEVLAHGHVEGVDYLLEEVVQGRHPRTPEEVRAAVEDLLPSLAGAYRSSGRALRTVSAMLPRDLPERLAAAVTDDSTPWPCDDEERAATGRYLVDLLAANRRLPCALGHGDLVATNIVRDSAGRHRLIDWEHGRVLPVAFDVGKLLQTAQADADLRHRARSVQGWGTRFAKDVYAWPEQLALGLCRRVAYGPERRRRALAAGREDRFDREHAGEVNRLLELVRDHRG